MTRVPEWVCAGCESLESFELGTNMSNIGRFAFEGCKGLAALGQYITGNITTIEEGAFRNCDGIVYLSLPESVKSVGERAFAECDGLVSVTLPESLTIISNSLFESCSNLKSVEMGSKVTEIGSYAFSWSAEISYIVIPMSVTRIGYNPFINTQALYFLGTSYQWSKISFDNKSELDYMPVYFYSETDTSATDDWHYVDDVPTPWSANA